MKMALCWMGQVGGPPRVGRGRLSAAWHKAGPEVLSAPMQSPAVGLQALRSWPRGDCWRLDALRGMSFYGRETALCVPQIVFQCPVNPVLSTGPRPANVPQMSRKLPKNRILGQILVVLEITGFWRGKKPKPVVLQ